MMLEIFNYWLVWILPFLGFSLIGLVIHLAGRKPRGKAPGRDDAYTCGEGFPVTNMGHENFYRPIKKALELSRLRHAHTGRLSDYLIMLVIGLAIVLAMVVVFI